MVLRVGMVGHRNEEKTGAATSGLIRGLLERSIGVSSRVCHPTRRVTSHSFRLRVASPRVEFGFRLSSSHGVDVWQGERG